MNHSMKRIVFSAAAVILLLTACIPGQATADPIDVANQVATSVALTVAAQNTQTAAAIPPATETPLPTQTELPSPTALLPTATPFVIVPPTTVPSGGGGGGSTTKPEYACDIIRRRPFDNTIFRPKADFDIRWTIINVGTKTMHKGLDLKYFSGPEMTAPGPTHIELPELKPREQFSVVLGATAPSSVGFHVMTWTVEGQLCFPYVAIYVEK